MLEVIFKVAVVIISVRPISYAFALHFTVYKFAFVLPPIGPNHSSIADDIILWKLTCILFARFCKIVSPKSTKLAI